jgi:hypothetical protein
VDYQRRTPLEVPRLREWAGHLIESYDALVHRGEIGYSQRETRLYRDSFSAARACNGEFKRPVKARIRELLALGAASYGLAAGAPGPGPFAGFPGPGLAGPAAIIPRQVSFAGEAVVDFAVCALWPVAPSPTPVAGAVP